MIRVTPHLSLDESEVVVEFVRASGPGGQHVNKTSTAVELRFDVARSPSLTDEVRARLLTLAGNRLTTDGILVIDARRFRSQKQNRDDALERLLDLLRSAAHRPRVRRKTKPSTASRRKRLENKQRRGQLKRTRGRVSNEQ
jgi:ribosome-associated protein